MAADNCPSEQELSAYHDGELSELRRAQVAGHVSSCVACGEVLARWEAMSRLFEEAPHQRLSMIASQRIRRRMSQTADGGIVRLAWMMSGLAASVLVAGSLWLTQLNDNTANTAFASPPPWLGVAYARDATQTQREPATPAAEWYLASNNTADELP